VSCSVICRPAAIASFEVVSSANRRTGLSESPQQVTSTNGRWVRHTAASPLSAEGLVDESYRGCVLEAGLSIDHRTLKPPLHSLHDPCGRQLPARSRDSEFARLSIGER